MGHCHYLIIVARDCTDLFQQLSARQSPEVQVIVDRRAPVQPKYGVSYTSLERDGYIVLSLR